MRPSFAPRLVNDPFNDPALFIPFLFQHRAVMFDLGDLSALSPRDVLKTSHVFVTHTHMDHFIGFDRLLRLLLGREQKIRLYGPEGFLKNVEGKLAGYSWDLVRHYTSELTIEATEVRPDLLTTGTYSCRHGFGRRQSPQQKSWKTVLVEEPSMTISAVVLNHSIACLGLKISERFHVNIRKDRLQALALRPGSWLQRFKEALYRSKPSDTVVEAESSDGGRVTFRLGELEEQIAVISEGQQVCYITDVGYTKSNVDRIVSFAAGVDHLFIEAAFLDEDRRMAGAKNHLTARQAGEIGGMARVKLLTPFHFSPRYQGKGHLLEAEAQKAYRKAMAENRIPLNTTGIR